MVYGESGAAMLAEDGLWLLLLEDADGLAAEVSGEVLVEVLVVVLLLDDTEVVASQPVWGHVSFF